jgi:hypothetical protein
MPTSGISLLLVREFQIKILHATAHLFGLLKGEKKRDSILAGESRKAKHKKKAFTRSSCYYRSFFISNSFSSKIAFQNVSL